MARSLGPLVYVMGPSGAGKDSVLRFARAALRPEDRIAFAHRYVTRPQDVSEDFVALTESEFRARRTAGLFTFEWQAHGLSYGIGIEIEAWRRAGLTVVISGSRTHFASLGSNGDVIPVLVTAPRDVLDQRLRARGRESSEDIHRRLARTPGDHLAHQRLVTIDNSGDLSVAGSRFLELIREITAATA